MKIASNKRSLSKLGKVLPYYFISFFVLIIIFSTSPIYSDEQILNETNTNSTYHCTIMNAYSYLCPTDAGYRVYISPNQKYYNDNGWQSFAEKVNLNRDGRNINLSVEGKFDAYFEVEPSLNGNVYTWQQVFDTYPDMEFSVNVKKYDYKVKFDLNLTNGAGMGVNLPEESGLMLHLLDSHGLRINDAYRIVPVNETANKTILLPANIEKVDEGIKFFDKFVLVIPDSCNAQINKSTIWLTTLTEECLDPTLTLSGSSSTVDGNIYGTGSAGGPPDTFTNESIQETFIFEDLSTISDYKKYRPYIEFNVSNSIPSGATILTVDMNISVGETVDSELVNVSIYSLELNNYSVAEQPADKIWTDICDGQVYNSTNLWVFNESGWKYLTLGQTYDEEDVDNATRVLQGNLSDGNGLFGFGFCPYSDTAGDGSGSNYHIYFDSVESANDTQLIVEYSYEIPTDFQRPTFSGTGDTATINVTTNESSLLTVSELTWNFNNSIYTLYSRDTVLLMNFNNESTLGDNLTQATDFSLNSYNGTIEGAIYNNSGKYNGAMTFDGTNDYVENDVQLVTDYPFTVSAWVMDADDDSVDAFVFIGESGLTASYYDIRVNETGQVGISARNTTSQSYTVFGNNPDIRGGWHHIVGVWNSSTYRALYVDGVLYVESTDEVDFLSANDRYSIGRLGDGSPALYWKGSIDEVMIFNRTVAGDEVSQIYKSNLRKVGSWEYKTSESSLPEGDYQMNLTIETEEGITSHTNEILTFTINDPVINFNTPTPNNASTTDTDSIYVNYTVAETNDHTVFTDFNGDLIGYWRMDDVNSTWDIIDNSTYGHNGTLVNNPITDTGRWGDALDFNYIEDEYIVIDNGNESWAEPENLTLEVWVYPTGLISSSGLETIAGKYEQNSDAFGYSLFIYKNRLYARVVVEGGASGTQRNVIMTGFDAYYNQWNHAVLRWDRIAGLTLWLNGVQQGSAVGGSGDLMRTNSSIWFLVGTDEDFGHGRGYHSFDGKIDEVRLWNRALTNDEIKASYNAKVNTLVGHNYTALEDDTYKIRGYVQEPAGHLNYTNERWITLGEGGDTTKPTLTIDFPTNTTYSTSITEYNFTASDETALDSCWYSNDTGLHNSSINDCLSNFTGIDLSDGQYNLTIWANDSSNNEQTASVVFIQDTIFPTFSNYADNNGSHVGTGTGNFSVDILNTNGTVWLQINNTNYTAEEYAIGKFNASVYFDINDTWSYYWISYSNFSQNLNTSELDLRYYTINNSEADTTFPTLTINFPANTTYGVNVSDLNFTASDDVALDSCWYSTDNGNTNSTSNDCYANFTDIVAIDGSNNWTLWGNDSSSNEQIASVIFIQDTLYPSFDNYADNNNTMNGSGTGNFSVDIWDTNGTVFLFINNTNYTAENYVDNKYNASVYFDINDTWQYYWISYSNFSANLNTSEDVLRFFTINNTIPEPDVAYPEFSSQWDNNNTLEGSGTGLFNITILNNNGSAFVEINNTNYSATLTGDLANVSIDFDINDSWTYYWGSWGNGTDSLYNFSITYAYTVNATPEADITPPSITISYPTNITYNTLINLLNYTIDEVDGSCWYSTDNGDTNSSMVDAGTNFTDVTDFEGQNNWTIWCNDSSSNEGIASVVFIQDTTNPQLTIEFPGNYSYSLTQVDLNISATEELSHCNLTLGDWTYYYNLTKFNSTLHYYTNSSIGEGQYIAVFICNDTAGNLNATEQVTFNLDTTNPQVNITLPENTTYTSNPISIEFRLDETGYCEYSLNAGTTNSTLTPNSTLTGYIGTTSPSNAQYIINAYCNDTANNFNLTENMTFFLSTEEAPTGGQGTNPFIIEQNIREVICYDVYYFLLNNPKYNQTDLNNLTKSIRYKVGYFEDSLIEDYIEYFNNWCGYLGLIKPRKPLPLITFNSSLPDVEICSTDIGLGFFDMGLSFLKIDIGTNLPCEKIDNWRWLFKIESEGNNYFITGLKLWYIIIALLFGSIVFVVVMYKYNKKFNEKIGEMLSRKGG